ncbi:MAG: mechanosensitive ion channel family protein [Tannerella sp.]|nr:mechanosensitive ion channel family protein [Tannerella sp.]
MLDQIYYGNSLKDWAISILIIIAAIVINKIIVLLNKKVIHKITSKSNTLYDNIFFSALEKPVLMGIMAGALWSAAYRLNLDMKVHDIIAKAYQILIVLNITWFFARFASLFIEQRATEGGNPQKGRLVVDSKLLPLIKRGLLIAIWSIGLIMALNNIGVKVTTLLGTLGIGGIAFALAAQDTIKNIFGGITIFTDQTFRIGDIIKFDNTEGMVIDIGLRSTRIRTYAKQLVTVPNYKLMDALVTNISSEPARRIVLELGLTYDTTPEQMEEALHILKQIPFKVPEVREKDLVTQFSNFGESALIITFIYFIKKPADIRSTNSNVNFEILRSFTKAGLNFAFPTRTVYMENLSDTNINAPANASAAR